MTLRRISPLLMGLIACIVGLALGGAGFVAAAAQIARSSPLGAATHGVAPTLYRYDEPTDVAILAHHATPASTTGLLGMRAATRTARPDSQTAPLSSTSPTAASLATKGAEEAGTPIYRGVARDHPGYDDALQGTAHPRNPSGATSAEAHNAGATADSPFTSWTHSRAVAERYAGENGAILGLRTGRPGPGWSFEWSPDIWHEQEVLIRGTVRGARVHRP